MMSVYFVMLWWMCSNGWCTDSLDHFISLYNVIVKPLNQVVFSFSVNIDCIRMRELSDVYH